MRSQAGGDRCKPMDLYLIAAAGRGIPTAENMAIMFPGYQVKRWAPVASTSTANILRTA